MSKLDFVPALAAFIWVFLALPAAADVVSITQAKALNGSVTPGDRPGFPVTISRPGSYRLDTNLDFTGAYANKDGIEIMAFDVTIDFNGFRLHGFGHGRYGIFGSRDTATIKNGIIAGFTNTAVSGRAFWTVEAMQVLVNGRGIKLGDAGRVHDNTISNNSATGVECGDGCIVINNVIRANGYNGVLIGSGTVLGNAIVGNSVFGIDKFADDRIVGYGNNTLFGNNAGGAQVRSNGLIIPLHPNACRPAC